jgi:hypothetical protein
MLNLAELPGRAVAHKCSWQVSITAFSSKTMSEPHLIGGCSIDTPNPNT